MRKNDIYKLVEVMVGFSSGVIIGGGFVAILTVLGVIPRLVQISKSVKLVNIYASSVILGVLFGTYLSFTTITWDQPMMMLLFWGAIHGIFNGMLAAALTEILNVFPLLSKRIGLEKYIFLLLMAIVFGKITGSLFQWLYLVR
ncbi:stage V sporulation protein AB [Pseudogracilibacillus sp. SE30717A]|uniref:stage V sporulation protein AB n=1 Tax=Pseudogracilibacillus sp. SE30717A TaxID=3098293 RepID=UPI00300DD695